MRWPVLRALLVASLAFTVVTPSVAHAQKKKPAGKKTEKKEEMKPDDASEEKTEKKEEKAEKKEEKTEKKEEGGKPKPPPDPKDPKPLGAPGEGPGPSAGIHGPQTGLSESDASKPQSNPWGKAGVSAKGDGTSPTPSRSYASRTGPEIGGRLGLMLPMGEATRGLSFADAAATGIPVMLDVGYRFVPQVYVGLYGQFAWVFRPSDGCPGNATCTAQDYRFGIDVAYHIPIGNSYEIWVGGGAGYEIFHTSTSTDQISLGATFSGLEYFNLQTGFDILTDGQTRVGPYLGFTGGQFSSASLSSSGTNSPANPSSSTDIGDKAFHHWISLGVRGAYTF